MFKESTAVGSDDGEKNIYLILIKTDRSNKQRIKGWKTELFELLLIDIYGFISPTCKFFKMSYLELSLLNTCMYSIMKLLDTFNTTSRCTAVYHYESYTHRISI